MPKREKQKNRHFSHKKQSVPHFLPAAFLLILWPCLVHMDEVATGLEEMPWYPDVAVQSDFFMHIRSVTLLGIAVWMLLVMIDRILLQQISGLNLKTAAPLLVYALLAVLSTVFSVNRTFSLTGSAEQFENIWTLLAYLVICWYFADTFRNFSCEQQFLSYLLIGAAVQALIGLSQMAGYDFWNSALGTWLILLGSDSAQTLSFAFAENGTTQVYMSFYNPNYAAVYIILVLPFAVYAAVSWKETWKKAAAVLLAAALVVCLWGTESEAGLLVLCVLIFAGGLLFIRKGSSRLRFVAICLVCLGYVIVQGLISSEESVVTRIVKNVIPEQKQYKLQEVTPEQDAVRIRFADQEYRLRIDREDESVWFSVIDQDGAACRLEYDEATGRFSFADKNYQNLEFQATANGEEFRIIMYRLDIPWQFVKKDADSPYVYYTVYDKEDTPVNAEYTFGEGYERALSNRVYLWSRTVPLVDNYLLLGSGPDTFSLVFPQNDYVTRANQGIDMLTQIITKPHSFYLQTAVQTGLVSLLMLLWFFGKYLYQAVSGQIRYVTTGVYLNSESAQANCSGNNAVSEQERMFRLAVLLSVTGFLIMGIANDSVVVTSPVFWAVLGTGYGNVK